MLFPLPTRSRSPIMAATTTAGVLSSIATAVTSSASASSTAIPPQAGIFGRGQPNSFQRIESDCSVHHSGVKSELRPRFCAHL